MGDLISRQALLEKKKRIPIAMIVTEDKIIYRDVVFVKDIEVLPSADPERKKGKWIDKSGGIKDAWNYCSICGEQAIDLYDFCPNCGADMRGEEE